MKRFAVRIVKVVKAVVKEVYEYVTEIPRKYLDFRIKREAKRQARRPVNKIDQRRVCGYGDVRTVLWLSCEDVKSLVMKFVTNKFVEAIFWAAGWLMYIAYLTA